MVAYLHGHYTIIMMVYTGFTVQWKLGISTDKLYHSTPMPSNLVDFGSDFKVAMRQWSQAIGLGQCDRELAWPWII